MCLQRVILAIQCPYDIDPFAHLDITLDNMANFRKNYMTIFGRKQCDQNLLQKNTDGRTN